MYPLANLRRWWRARLRGLDAPTPQAWAALLETLPLLARYPRESRDRLRELSGEFLRSKRIEAAGGLALEEHMRLAIAAQACVPVLSLGLRWYRGWTSVIVYPAGFVARHQYTDEAGVVHDVERPLIGESWEQGPLILSWEDVEDDIRAGSGGNVVIHEVAHKLDSLNGVINGMPPLHSDMRRSAWTEALSSAFEDLTRRLERGEPVPLDDYAAEDPGEFFAVVSEAFFIEPETLAGSYPRVYEQLCDFYRQDPLALSSASGGSAGGTR